MTLRHVHEVAQCVTLILLLRLARHNFSWATEACDRLFILRWTVLISSTLQRMKRTRCCHQPVLHPLRKLYWVFWGMTVLPSLHQMVSQDVWSWFFERHVSLRFNLDLEEPDAFSPRAPQQLHRVIPVSCFSHRRQLPGGCINSFPGMCVLFGGLLNFDSCMLLNVGFSGTRQSGREGNMCSCGSHWGFPAKTCTF